MKNRVFILGAGFSKAAGMPLATELLKPIAERLDLEDMENWLRDISDRLAWLQRVEIDSPFTMNIEQVFHFAHFDAETHRLLQHLEPVGRNDGPGTAWNDAHARTAWLSFLERELCDVILDTQSNADTAPIELWAGFVTDSDTILSFNYDTLVERSLEKLKKKWNHGTAESEENGSTVCKLHGSIDWIVAHREENFSKFDLIFDKQNENRGKENTGFIEDDYRLWRCHDSGQLGRWIRGRHLQMVPPSAVPRWVGIAGLGAYKPLHHFPGLGRVWVRGMQALNRADQAIIIGFSMSDFDAMAQLHFADVAKERITKGNPLPVTIIDPFLDETAKNRFLRVFRTVEFITERHEEIEWSKV